MVIPLCQMEKAITLAFIKYNTKGGEKMSIISVICGITVLIACCIYFIIDIKQNREQIMNVVTYFLVRFILSCIVALFVAYLIAI